MFKKTVSLWLFATAAAFVLTACGSDPAPVAPSGDPAGGAAAGAEADAAAAGEAEAEAAAEAEAEAAAEEEAPEEEVTEYTYDPIGKRDPFRSLVVQEIENKPKAKTPLQRYDIDQLKVVGIIWGISNPKAMIHAPDGKGYVVGKGTPVGKGRGKVTRITQKEVVISEEYRDFEGKLLVNETALTIQKSTL